jgi:hypothetical protein
MRFAPVVLGWLCAAQVLLPREASGQQAPRGADPLPPEYVAPPLAIEAGGRLGYDFDLAAWSLGGQLRVPIVPGLYLIPSGDYFLRTPGVTWQLNLDAAIRLGWYAGLYGGAGLGIAHRAIGSGRTQTGLNVFAGFTPPRVRRRLLWPFIEARWVLIQNRSPFGLRAGLNVLLER